MNRKTILALALASVFAASTSAVFAQSDEQEPKKPEQPQLIVADGDEKETSKPELIADGDEKQGSTPELIAEGDDNSTAFPEGSQYAPGKIA